MWDTTKVYSEVSKTLEISLNLAYFLSQGLRETK